MIELVIRQRRRDLGGFRSRPGAALPRSVDVRPHPHIGLSWDDKEFIPLPGV